ncbi:unnamed protein product [Moneuplotes crassus]|uniref:Uncharacterized protein n=1 Tax=Euplotes crassus TaxID=5936 RepID=A0AAD1XJ91_EUPCR|nr:unnamed protein product [Moneuplotes crassus]
MKSLQNTERDLIPRQMFASSATEEFIRAQMERKNKARELRMSQNFSLPSNLIDCESEKRVIPFYEIYQGNADKRCIKRLITSRRRRSVAVPLGMPEKRASIIPSAYKNQTRNLYKEIGISDIKQSAKDMEKKLSGIKKRINSLRSRGKAQYLSKTKKELYKDAYEKVKNNKYKYEIDLRTRYNRMMLQKLKEIKTSPHEGDRLLEDTLRKIKAFYSLIS